MCLNLIILSLVLNLAVVSQGLNTFEYCKLTKTECTGRYDYKYNYEENCKKINCHGKFEYQCTKDICSTSKSSCELFSNVNLLIKSLTNSRMFYKQMSIFQKFQESLSECMHSHQELNPNDVCSNGKSCYYKRTYTLRNEKKTFAAKIVCPCVGEHSFHCGNDLCTTNNIACDLYFKSNHTSIMKKCGNDNQIIKNKVKLF